MMEEESELFLKVGKMLQNHDLILKESIIQGGRHV